MSSNADAKVSQPFHRLDVGRASSVGKVRTHNEDSIITLDLFIEDNSGYVLNGLYAVADGMGGHEGGEIASKLALQVFTESVMQNLLVPALRNRNNFIEKDSIVKELVKAVSLANMNIYDHAQAAGNGMGTTLTAALIIDRKAYFANVGDSRVYALLGNQLTQVTRDHSVVAELVDAGKITPDEVYTHPRRNMITRCLGTYPKVEVDLFSLELQSNDVLLLCCDGLWEMVRDNEIQDIILKANNPSEACVRLVEAANRNGGVDNISVIVVKAIS